jgi:hypothetical protein
MKREALTIALSALAAGCGSSTSGESGDAGPDHGSDAIGNDAAHDATHPGDATRPEGGREAGPPDGGEAAPPDGGLEAGQCRTASDCSSTPGDLCLQFTLPAMCKGSCTTGTTCTLDDECADAGAGFVCSNFCECARTGGADAGPGGFCIAGCTSTAECGSGKACSAAHHCEPASCNEASDCGPNFACPSGTCVPAPCKTDKDCKDGDFCTVESFRSSEFGCFPHLGACTPEGA